MCSPRWDLVARYLVIAEGVFLWIRYPLALGLRVGVPLDGTWWLLPPAAPNSPTLLCVGRRVESQACIHQPIKKYTNLDQLEFKGA